LLKTRLQSVVVGICARLQQVNVIKTGIRPWHDRQSRGQDTGLRLIDVARRQQLRSLGADISNFQHALFTDLSLHIQIPMLHVASAQIALDREGGVRQRQGEERRKLITER